jgi:hypothetical protein
VEKIPVCFANTTLEIVKLNLALDLSPGKQNTNFYLKIEG